MSVAEEMTEETGVPTIRALVPACTSATTAGWRTGGRDWRFLKVTATVTVPNRLPGTCPHPDATIGLQGFGDNSCGLAIGVTADAGSGATAYYGYDIGTSNAPNTPFPLPGLELPLHSGDVVKMQISHDHAACREEFTVTVTRPGQPPVSNTVVVDIPAEHNDQVYYRHAGWDAYLNTTDATWRPGTDEGLWLYRDCHVTGENTVTGEVVEAGVFGPWATWQEIATRTGGPTGDPVMYPGWPWKDKHVNFAMRLHRVGTRAEPMARTWFPDAGAGASAAGLALIAKQIADLAAAGFGGAEIAFLSDNTHYTNADAKTIGFGSENWRRILKQILRTANGIPSGFGIDLTLSSHWPVATNNIDPNDDAQQQQTFQRVGQDHHCRSDQRRQGPAAAAAAHP